VRGRTEGFDRSVFDKAIEAEFGKAQRKSATLRKRHARYATDDDLVDEAIEGIENRTYPNPLKAAEALSSRAEGISDVAKVERLRKKISRVLKFMASAP
jgi:hypothetical protein